MGIVAKVDHSANDPAGMPHRRLPRARFTFECGSGLARVVDTTDEDPEIVKLLQSLGCHSQHLVHLNIPAQGVADHVENLPMMVPSAQTILSGCDHHGALVSGQEIRYQPPQQASALTRHSGAIFEVTNHHGHHSALCTVKKSRRCVEIVQTW